MGGGALGHRFFYVSLCDGATEGPKERGGRDLLPLEGVRHAVADFGIRRFLDDIDSGRTFTAEGGIVGAFLKQAATASFGNLFGDGEHPFHCARDFRERNLIELTKALTWQKPPF